MWIAKASSLDGKKKGGVAILFPGGFLSSKESWLCWRKDSCAKIAADRVCPCLLSTLLQLQFLNTNTSGCQIRIPVLTEAMIWIYCRGKDFTIQNQVLVSSFIFNSLLNLLFIGWFFQMESNFHHNLGQVYSSRATLCNFSQSNFFPAHSQLLHENVRQGVGRSREENFIISSSKQYLFGWRKGKKGRDSRGCVCDFVYTGICMHSGMLSFQGQSLFYGPLEAMPSEHCEFGFLPSFSCLTSLQDFITELAKPLCHFLTLFPKAIFKGLLSLINA